MQSDVLSKYQKDNQNRLIVIIGSAIKPFLYLTAASSLGYIVSLLTFYFHARNILHRFPTYDNPDPGKLVAYKKFASIIDPALEIWSFCFLIWILLVIIYLGITRNKRSWKHIALSSIAHLVAWAITFSGIFTWYVD